MANFGPVKTWGNEVLTPADLNAEILNIINNVTDGGINADNIDETDAYTWSGATTFTGTVTTGVDDTGVDVKFFGATTGKSWLWDESANKMIIAGDAAVTGATTLTGATQQTGAFTVGVNDTGHDVKFFGATASKFWEWDESANQMNVAGSVDVNGATQMDGTLTVGLNDTGYDVQLFGATAGSHLLWDESADSLLMVGGAKINAQGTVTVGVDDTGYDVKMFGATSGKSWLWDESADTEILTGNSTISGTLGVTGVLTATAQSVHTGGLVSGSNIVSDTDSTDDLGTTGVRWANLYVDAIVATDTIAATSYTGALLTAVTAVTQSDSNNSTKVATTAYVDSMVGGVTGVSLSGSTNNTIATVTGANALIGEGNLTFDGTDLAVGNAAPSSYMNSVHGLIVGDTGDATSEITLATTTSGKGELNWTSTADTTNQASINYAHNTTAMTYESTGGHFWKTNGTEHMRLQAGNINLNDTANGFLTQGISINQGANDNEILALKSSDVAHGVTGVTETDTYGLLKKISATRGGLDVAGFMEGESTVGLRLSGTSGEDTSDTSGSNAMIRISANKVNGTAQAVVGNTGNILAVQNQATTRMILKGNGDMHITNTTLTALDGEDDVGLVRAFQRSASDGLGMAMTEWDKQVTANEEDLRRVGVLSSTSDFVIQQRMNSLLGGSVWQLHVAQKEMQKVYETEIAELKGQLNLLMERN